MKLPIHFPVPYAKKLGVPIVGRMKDKILSSVGFDFGRVLVRMHALLHVLQDNEVVHCFSKQALMLEYSLAYDLGAEDLQTGRYLLYMLVQVSHDACHGEGSQKNRERRE